MPQIVSKIHGLQDHRAVQGNNWFSPRVMRGGSYMCHKSYCNRYRTWHAADSTDTRRTRPVRPPAPAWLPAAPRPRPTAAPVTSASAAPRDMKPR